MIQISEKLFNELKDKWRELNNNVNGFYGSEYPNKCDKDGWKLLGLKEGLAYAINKIETENEKNYQASDLPLEQSLGDSASNPKPY